MFLDDFFNELGKVTIRFFTNFELCINKKTRHFRIGFCFAPLIGESYNFNAMIEYVTIRNLKEREIIL